MNYNLFIIMTLLVLMSFCYAFRAKLLGGQFIFWGLLVIWVAIVAYIYPIILSFTHPLIALSISVILTWSGSFYLLKSFKAQRESSESENMAYENIDDVAYIPFSELKINEEIIFEDNGTIIEYDRVQKNWAQTNDSIEEDFEHLEDKERGVVVKVEECIKAIEDNIIANLANIEETVGENKEDGENDYEDVIFPPSSGQKLLEKSSKIEEKMFLEEGNIHYLPPANNEQKLKEIWSLVENRKYTISDLIDLSFQCKEENDYVFAKEYLLAVINKSENINVKKIACLEAVYLYKKMGKYREAKQLVEVFISREGKYMPHEEIEHYYFLAIYLKYLDKFLKQVGKEAISFDQVPGLINNSALKISREEVNNNTGKFEKNNKVIAQLS